MTESRALLDVCMFCEDVYCYDEEHSNNADAVILEMFEAIYSTVPLDRMSDEYLVAAINLFNRDNWEGLIARSGRFYTVLLAEAQSRGMPVMAVAGD